MGQQSFCRGEIYLADLGKEKTHIQTSVQKKLRPVLIVSNDIGNKYSPTLIVAAITSKKIERKMPTHVNVGRKCGLHKPSVVLTEQIQTVDKISLFKYIGKLRELETDKVNAALKIAVGLRKIKESSEVRTLCNRCAAEYYDTGDYDIRFANPDQNYEPCMRCNSPRGKDRIITKLISDAQLIESL